MQDFVTDAKRVVRTFDEVDGRSRVVRVRK